MTITIFCNNFDNLTRFPLVFLFGCLFLSLSKDLACHRAPKFSNILLRFDNSYVFNNPLKDVNISL